MDGTTGAIQDRVRHQYTANAHSMMYHMNLFSSLYLLVGLFLTGELFGFMAFVRIYPKVMVQLLALAAASALGQVCTFLSYGCCRCFRKEKHVVGKLCLR